MNNETLSATVSPILYIVSGGSGASAEQLVNTVLAQFPKAHVNLMTMRYVRQPAQIRSVLEQAKAKGALVIHTMVDSKLRQLMGEESHAMGVQAIDLMGDLIGWLTLRLGQRSLEEPGKYRSYHKAYFDRIAAIDYAMAQDDGKNPSAWGQAEIVLVGVSRVGKTPLSLYLAVLGWKVANIPIIPQITVSERLFDLEQRRVFGMTMDPEQLRVYRYHRQYRLGLSSQSEYVELESIALELREARRVFQRGGFKIIDMTDKTIELAADEILRRVATTKDWEVYTL